MLPRITGKPIDLICSEQALPEFPDLLFGRAFDGSVSYFDATKYLQNKNLSVSVQDFFLQYEAPIKQLLSSYQITEDRACTLNREGHILIDGNLCYLFICFTEPDFLAYVCDRIQELFMNGFCLSDTALMHMAKHRLSVEILNQIIQDEQRDSKETSKDSGV